MPSKEQEFKHRFATLLQDLQEDGRHDAEAMWLIGSLAATLIDKSGTRSWPALKQALSPADYDGLLDELRTQGNAFHRDGRGKHAYAAQVLGMSLVARTQLRDADMRQGDVLLDELVQRAVAVYRRSRGPQSV